MFSPAEASVHFKVNVQTTCEEEKKRGGGGGTERKNEARWFSTTTPNKGIEIH